MNTYLKYKPAWLQLVIFGALTLGIFTSLIIISMAIISKVYGIGFEDLTNLNVANGSILSASKVLQAVSSISLFGVPALVFGYLSDAAPLQYLGFKKPIPPVFWILSIVLILASFPMAGWMAALNQQMHLPKSMASLEKAIRDTEEQSNTLLRGFLQMKSMGDLVAMIFILAVIPALTEELFFRGVIQRLFIQITRRPWAGIVITAFIFSAIHGQFLGFIPRFVLGALLGALYWYSGSLWPGILAHFINNALQVTVAYYYPKFIENEPDFSVGIVVISCFIVVALTWLITRLSQTQFVEVYDTEDEFLPGPHKHQ